MATANWSQQQSMQENRLTAGRETLPSEEYIARAMPTTLGSLDMTTTYLVAIFFIVNAATAAGGGAAAFTYLLLGGVMFFIPCVVATAQLGVMFPYEGSLYNWTHKALGGYWSFFIGFCAWFPGVLVIVSGADIVISYIQGLSNGNWLVAPWQQGIALLGIIIFSTVLALQRQRVIQNVVNVVVGLTFLGVLIIGFAGLVWLLKGKPSVTSFQTANWGINSNNYYLFGLITLAYLGTEVPLNMGGEISGRKVVTRHLLWGTLLVFGGYFIATLSLLLIQGTNAASTGGFSLVLIVDSVLGKFFGNVTAICIVSFFLIVPVVYNCTFARLLLVGGIDQRLPARVARLNKNRVPASAIIFQSGIAAVFIAVAFFVVPYVTTLGKPTDLANEVYNVTQAAATLVWAISTAFFFINIFIFYFRDRQSFNLHRIFPMPVLWLCAIVGPIACAVAIVDTLLNSWIPQIDNGHWWYIVGGLTLICLVIAGIGSMLASSEAAWQGLSEE
jgi:glutamate:GABA antiporter